MKRYYVNDRAQDTGEHEVHKKSCSHLPLIKSKTSLGMHSDCKDAAKKAKTIYSNVDGCFWCCPECHTR